MKHIVESALEQKNKEKKITLLNTYILFDDNIPKIFERNRIKGAMCNLISNVRLHDKIDILFIITDKDIDKKTLELIKNNKSIKVIFSSKQLENLNSISNTYIKNEIDFEEIHWFLKGIIESYTTPSLVGIDVLDFKALLKENDCMELYHYIENSTNGNYDFVNTKKIIKKHIEGKNCYIFVCGGNDMSLDIIARLGEIITSNLNDNATVIWGARMEDELKDKLDIGVYIGSKGD